MDQVGDDRGRTDRQADGEQVKATPHRGGHRFRYQPLLGPAKRHDGDAGVRRDRAAKKQECLSRGWDPARVGEDGSARPDGEGVAVGGGTCGDGRAERRPVAGQHRAVGLADFNAGLPGQWRLSP